MADNLPPSSADVTDSGALTSKKPFGPVRGMLYLLHICFMPIPVAVRPLACWDCGFGSDQRHGGLPVVIAVCCQVEISASV
jgi:hypothetical protein